MARHKFAPARQATAQQLMAKAFVHAGVTMNVADNPYMRQFLRYIGPGFHVPHRSRLTEEADVLAEDLRDKVKDHVLTAEFVSLTSDAATTVAGDSLEAITGHFIDKDWNMHSIVLAVFLLAEGHTAEYLCEVVNTVLQQWTLKCAVSMTTGARTAAATASCSRCLTGVLVADGAANCLRMSADLQRAKVIVAALRCLCHIINLW